jgi:hypothetical protein
MKQFVSNIFLGNLVEAKQDLQERIDDLVTEKLDQVKVRLMEEIYGGIDAEVDFVENELSEGNIQRMGRTKLIRVRIRKGKVQRRIKKSSVPGFIVRNNKLVRMSPQERRHRKMAARFAKFKRKSKMNQSIRKRQRSLVKRKAMGLQ